ncbi:hypothetical protein EV697_101530 [Bisgaardia hudsonensis]|uniref:MOSC domain-containing protein n=2 Tax=Bisgaardia hudsonensis TaxID=109472 RepID=A0A4R2N3H5_9PAST|nr:hypothetical protein EV697_101530 [Bisgaardia hudsonensis]
MLHEIYIYPIKSTKAYKISQSIVQMQGLNFDREFMLTDLNGKFITARTHSTLYELFAFPIAQGIEIHHKNGSFIRIQYQDFLYSRNNEVWGDHFPSLVAKQEINQWLTDKIKDNVQLRWLGEQSQRKIKHYPEYNVSFADGYPILLCTEESLEKVKSECPTEITMLQFRPNVVIKGYSAFSEQNWHEIQIGNVKFLHTHPCTRCILTTRNIYTNQLDPKAEPFRTLKRINTNENGKPLFGINLIPMNTGIIKEGDEIKILSYK